LAENGDSANLRQFSRNDYPGGAFGKGYRTGQESDMDKDRVEGTAKQVKGNLKEAAGKLTGDAKLKTEGKADKVEGKIQNAIGGAKDAMRDAVKKH
jgi:uncharacterized protein YjbJ (UPF0337 family)